jgi:hypothetical protein
MKTPLIKITPVERAALTQMTMHAGMPVLHRIMEQIVTHSSVQLMSVEPTDPQRAQKIADLQAVAYAQRSFCQTLFDNIDWQRAQEMADEEDDEPEQTSQEQALSKALIQAGYIKNEA